MFDLKYYRKHTLDLNWSKFTGSFLDRKKVSTAYDLNISSNCIKLAEKLEEIASFLDKQ